MPKSKTSLAELLHEIRRIEEHREVLTDRKIKAMYSTLSDDLDAFLAKEYKKYADADGRFFVSYLDAQNQRARFMQEIVENVDGITPKLRSTITTLIDDVYGESYKGMLEAFKKAHTAAEFERITKDLAVNPNVLKQAINNNISKLTLPAVLERHRSDIVYQIQQELNIGLMNGDRYETMAKRISERLGVSQSKAMNITRTETHKNIESGFMDCAEHISEGVEGSGFIYAATWRTMKDEKVRPQQRRKTKKGWVTTLSKNGANHIQMEGQTVKVGEMFNLGNGVKAKAPSQSGVAAHDCHCRCFIEYNLMTAEEFAKATGKKVDKPKQAKEQPAERVEIKLDDFPEAFTKGAEGKNTKKLIEYINGIEGADPNAVRLYSLIGELENLDANGIPFKISHGKSHAVSYAYSPANHSLKSVKINYPKLTGDNFAGQVNTTLHEQMHLLDLFGREDVNKYNRWFSVTRTPLVDTFKVTSADMSDEITELFTKHNAEYHSIRDRLKKKYDDMIAATREKYLPDGMSPWENMSGYRQYEKEAKKLRKAMTEEIDYESRNIMGGGICSLQDIYDALSGGTYRANGTVIYGHGQRYYAQWDNRIHEIVANYVSLSVTRPDLIAMLRRDKPDLCKELDDLVVELIKKAGA